jgi:2-iminobutanoate/2-iminopropanoate deaminase
MTNCVITRDDLLIDLECLTERERIELTMLGMLSTHGQLQEYVPLTAVGGRKAEIRKKAVHAPEVLNEAFRYAKPSSFSRGLRLDIGGYVILLISGTASIDENGRTIHVGDFGAQCWRTYRNISILLASEGATWHDVVKATCYLRDIERDYEQFNRIRTTFFSWLGLDPLPASVGVQTRLCREDLLVEIEAFAIFQGRDHR